MFSSGLEVLRSMLQTSLVVQWLGLYTPSAEGMGSFHAQWPEILYATGCGQKKKKNLQINKLHNLKKKKKQVAVIVITFPCFLFYLCFPLLHTILHFEEIFLQHISKWDFPGGSLVKNPPANAEDMRSIPGWGRSPGVGHGNPLQYSCLEKPKDRGAWESTFHEVTKSWTRLSDHTHISNTLPFLFLFHAFGPLTFSDTMSFLPEAPHHPPTHTPSWNSFLPIMHHHVVWWEKNEAEAVKSGPVSSLWPRTGERGGGRADHTVPLPVTSTEQGGQGGTTMKLSQTLTKEPGGGSLEAEWLDFHSELVGA